MAYNIKYQQKAYIVIMCIKIIVNILCNFLGNDLTNNILLNTCLLLSKYWTLTKTHSNLYFVNAI